MLSVAYSPQKAISAGIKLCRNHKLKHHLAQCEHLESVAARISCSSWLLVWLLVDSLNLSYLSWTPVFERDESLLLQVLCSAQRPHSLTASVGLQACKATLVPAVWKLAFASSSWEHGLRHAEMLLVAPRLESCLESRGVSLGGLLLDTVVWCCLQLPTSLTVASTVQTSCKQERLR